MFLIRFCFSWCFRCGFSWCSVFENQKLRKMLRIAHLNRWKCSLSNSFVEFTRKICTQSWRWRWWGVFAMFSFLTFCVRKMSIEERERRQRNHVDKREKGGRQRVRDGRRKLVTREMRQHEQYERSGEGGAREKRHSNPLRQIQQSHHSLPMLVMSAMLPLPPLQHYRHCHCCRHYHLSKFRDIPNW